MPVYRFRSIEEMNRFSPPEPPGSLADRVAAALRLGGVLRGHRPPLGVHKSRSIEEHQSLRARWEAGAPVRPGGLSLRNDPTERPRSSERGRPS